ncbi:MAG: hypothetical protein SH847_10285 [Roseiflexaceae bacterium]|nr:hypothetical protein [Roseiflexaceae bacterium]
MWAHTRRVARLRAVAGWRRLGMAPTFVGRAANVGVLWLVARRASTRRSMWANTRRVARLRAVAGWRRLGRAPTFVGRAANVGVPR